MQFFELHFNPPQCFKRKDKDQIKSVFDSFCFGPENIYEKKLGNLFLVGELKNVLPQNFKFIDNLALFLKKQYYSAPIKSSPETSLKETLKKTNEFLEQFVKNDNVSWLGNLNLAVLNLVSYQKNLWEINLTKVGEIVILLLRNGQIIDIGKNLESSEIEPYPLKIFSNIVSGKLIEDDIVLVLTKEIFSAFNFNGLLKKIVDIQPFEEKKFREALKEKEEDFLKLSGVCLLCWLKETSSKNRNLIQPIIFHPKYEKFFLSRTFSPILKLINFIKANSKFVSKKLILIFLLIFFLIIGFFLFKGERIKEFELNRKNLEEAKTKITQAKNFLIAKNEKEANFLLQDAWKQVLSQSEKNTPFSQEANSLKSEIEKQLYSVNKLEKIEEPHLFFEFSNDFLSKESLIPQRFLVFKKWFYFFNPFSSRVYKMNLDDKSGSILDAKKNIKDGIVYDNLILFFANPNILLFPQDDKLKEKIIQPVAPEFTFDKIFGCCSHIYFLDNNSGKIAKYPLRNFEKDESLIGKLWLDIKSSGKSIAFDGSIWILTKNKEIDHYKKGFYRETLKISVFPFLENPVKIWTSEKLSHLYLLEPKNKRLIVLTKNCEVFKQYQSWKFDNLLDFAVSPNGKIIWLLNHLKIYQINL